MNRVYLIGFAPSVAGFLLSLGVHVMALLDSLTVNVETFYETFYFIHIGLFAVWVPALVIFFIRTREIAPAPNWDVVVGGIPKVGKYLAGLIAVYAFLTMAIIIISSDAKTMSDASVILRFFSVGWMVFYGSAAGIYWSAASARKAVRVDSKTRAKPGSRGKRGRCRI